MGSSLVGAHHHQTQLYNDEALLLCWKLAAEEQTPSTVDLIEERDIASMPHETDDQTDGQIDHKIDDTF